MEGRILVLKVAIMPALNYLAYMFLPAEQVAKRLEKISFRQPSLSAYLPKYLRGPLAIRPEAALPIPGSMETNHAVGASQGDWAGSTAAEVEKAATRRPGGQRSVEGDKTAPGTAASVKEIGGVADGAARRTSRRCFIVMEKECRSNGERMPPLLLVSGDTFPHAAAAVSQFSAAGGDWAAFHQWFAATCELAGQSVEAPHILPTDVDDAALAAFFSIPEMDRTMLRQAYAQLAAIFDQPSNVRQKFGTAREPQGSQEPPPAEVVTAAKTKRSPPTILPTKGMVRPTAAIWSGTWDHAKETLRLAVMKEAVCRSRWLPPIQEFVAGRVGEAPGLAIELESAGRGVSSGLETHGHLLQVWSAGPHRKRVLGCQWDVGGTTDALYPAGNCSSSPTGSKLLMPGKYSEVASCEGSEAGARSSSADESREGPAL
ncbi:unnamed protein product [Lampetra fluviatilis]